MRSTRTELGPALKWFTFSLPVGLHRRVLDFCTRMGADRDDVVCAALRERVAWIEAHRTEQRSGERWTLFLPLDLVNRLREVCDLNGLDGPAVIESALREHMEAEAADCGRPWGAKGAPGGALDKTLASRRARLAPSQSTASGAPDGEGNGQDDGAPSALDNHKGERS